MGLNIMTLYLYSRENLMRGWIYRNIIFSFPTIFGGGDYIVTLYCHPWQYFLRGWLYCDIIFSLMTILAEGVGVGIFRDILFLVLTIFEGKGVIISRHHIFTPDNICRGSDYIIPDTPLESGTGGDYIWIFPLSKFDSAVIQGFYY